MERVFIRIGSAPTDDVLQAELQKFLQPLILKLSSSHEAVRKKVIVFISFLVFYYNKTPLY